jgi:hypothetical protein
MKSECFFYKVKLYLQVLSILILLRRCYQNRGTGVSGHDSYNLDETGVNCRAQPSKTLAYPPRSGFKLAKDRVTALLCVNATGTTFQMGGLALSEAPEIANIWRIANSNCMTEWFAISEVLLYFLLDCQAALAVSDFLNQSDIFHVAFSLTKHGIFTMMVYSAVMFIG